MEWAGGIRLTLSRIFPSMPYGCQVGFYVPPKMPMNGNLAYLHGFAPRTSVLETDVLLLNYRYKLGSAPRPRTANLLLNRQMQTTDCASGQQTLIFYCNPFAFCSFYDSFPRKPELCYAHGSFQIGSNSFVYHISPPLLRLFLSLRHSKFLLRPCVKNPEIQRRPIYRI